jgi:XTP/dITP diphosphohydrolase
VNAAATNVVVATRNAHKVREIAALFEEAGVRLQLVPIDEIAPSAELREDEDTFTGNALAKARQAAAATGWAALADDSGIEADALDGAPGVWSARYAGVPCDDRRNNEKLLHELAGIPPDRRGARYQCAAVYVDSAQGIELVRTGMCEVRVLEAARGTGGFGYDPLMLIEPLGKTMAEISLAEKNRLSHRALAFRALTSALRARGIG